MSFPRAVVDELLARTGRMCAICQERHNLQVHHIVPTSEGGSDATSNAIPLCPNCHDQVHSRRAPGRVTRLYSPEELRRHLERTIRLANKQEETAAENLEGEATPGLPRTNVSGQAIAGQYQPRSHRDHLSDGMAPDALILRTVLGTLLEPATDAPYLSEAIHESLPRVLTESSFEGWLQTEAIFMNAQFIQPWTAVGPYNRSVISTLRWEGLSSQGETPVLRGQCRVALGPTQPIAVVILDAVLSVSAQGTAAPLPFERFYLALRDALETCVVSVGEAVFSEVLGPTWQPHGPSWLLDGGSVPLHESIDLSHFRRLPNPDHPLDYSMPAREGFDLWKKGDRNQLIRSWLERFLLDLQYQGFGDELRDILR